MKQLTEEELLEIKDSLHDIVSMGVDLMDRIDAILYEDDSEKEVET